MTLRLVRLATLGLPLVFVGCLGGFPVAPAATPLPVFDPAVFFSGTTHGEGALDVRFGDGRTLTVLGKGTRLGDGRFQLDQTITYGNGAVETRRWVLRQRDSTHYSATLSDATGEVTAESRGNVFHLRYKIREPHVYMEQWLYLQPDGRSVINRAQVSVLGVPYARLTETITREGR